MTAAAQKTGPKVSDTVAAGAPTLSATTGAQVNVTPSTAGNFILVCYYDTNANGSYNGGEEIRVLRFAIVRATLQTGVSSSFIDTGGPHFVGQSTPPEYGVFPDPNLPTAIEMVLQCKVLLEGGGSNRVKGVSLMKLGDIGNLAADSAKVNYAGGGMGTENPGGALPMADSADDPTEGNGAYRASSLATTGNGPGGNGKMITVLADDNPGFGKFKIVNSLNSHTWASTQGGYDFVEYIAGYSTSFKKYYVVFAQATWTVRVVGNNVAGNWSNTASAITLQGGTSHPQTLTSMIMNGNEPKSASTAGVQVLGSAFALHHSYTYTP